MAVEQKAKIDTCSACGKKMSITIGTGPMKIYNCDSDCMKALGVNKLPNSGWHWYEMLKDHKRVRMYPICKACHDKLEDIYNKRARTIKGKITVVKD